MYQRAFDSTEPPQVDLAEAVEFIIDLQIARRQSADYAKGHPLIGASLLRACRRLETLLAEKGDLSLGIGRDVLRVGPHPLGEGHPACLSLARELGAHRVETLSFRRGLSVEELLLFHDVLGESPDVLRNRGGIASVLNVAGVRHLQLRSGDGKGATPSDERALAQAVKGRLDDSLQRFLRRDGDLEALGGEVADLCHQLLAAGEFSTLTEVYERCGDNPLLVRIFGASPFLEGVLAGLDRWGKSKQGEIRVLIRTVGPPFVEPLLERLAEESKTSVRRFLMERLTEQGEALREAAINRLWDKRWYVVRNLVIMLRGLDDPAILLPLHRLLGHPHPRVRQETLRTFLSFRDPEGDRFLLREFGGSDPEQRLQAVQSAQYSRSPQVVDRLLSLLREGGTRGEPELKLAIVRTLAEIGSPSALPELARLLGTRTLLPSPPLHRLKVEIIRGLARYPQEKARPLLDKMAKPRSGELAALAREVRGRFSAEGS